MAIWEDPVNPAALAYAEHLALEEITLQKEVVLYRDLYHGSLNDTLRAELARSLLQGEANDIPGAFNYFGTVIDEVLDRLGIVNLTSEPPSNQGITRASTGQAGVFLSPNGDDNQPENQVMQPAQAPTVEWAMEWWQKNNMDELQFQLFESLLVDKEAFLILQPEALGRGEFDIIPYVERRYTDAIAGGDNLGCKMHYMDSKPYMASKRWIETITSFDPSNEGEKVKTTSYMMIYAAPEYNKETGDLVREGSIRKYRYAEAANRQNAQWLEETDARKIWNMPLPIFHFRLPKSKGRGNDAAGAQILMDNFNISMSVAASLMALPILIALGMYPTQDGEAPDSTASNLWEITAGGIIAAPTKGPETGSVEWLRPADLTSIIAAIDQSVNHLAITTGTPSLMSQKVRADAAAELIRRIEGRPIASARRIQIKAGNTFTQMFRVLRDMKAEFAKEKVEEGDIYPRWQTADTAVTAIASTEEQPVVTGYEMNAQERIAASK